MHPKQRPHITKYVLMFKYVRTNDAFNSSIRSVKDSIQAQCTSNARILKHYWQYQHSIKQDIFMPRCA